MQLVFILYILCCKPPKYYSIEKAPLKLTLKKVSISALFEENSKIVREYQIDVWNFLERTDGVVINEQNNITLGGFSLLTNNGERIPYTGGIV